ncbi:MAG: PilN domain-containing protein [Sedimentisphaerales bacterium]
MKEIDFLPEWYKQGRVQQEKHREFYVAIGLIVFIMAAWGIFANGRVAAAKAKNVSLQNTRLTRTASEAEYNKVESEYEQLKAKYQMTDSIKSHIVVSNVIAELTHLLDSGVILKKLNIKAEPFPEQNKKTGITTAGTTSADEALQFAKKVKFKITLTGLAADSTQVAEIINKLEQSKYFFQIVPSFSRNTTIGQYQASEFEIVCYLANYKSTN